MHVDYKNRENEVFLHLAEVLLKIGLTEVNCRACKSAVLRMLTSEVYRPNE